MTLDPVLVERIEQAATKWAPHGRVVDATALPGGRSSETYLVRCVEAPNEQVVVKAAPKGLKPTGNRDVLRQARLIEALSGCVAVPQVLFHSEGTSDDEEPPFFAMSFVPGECFEPNIDEPERDTSASEIHGRAMAASRELATLHNQEPSRLVHPSEGVITPLDEIQRWQAAFATVEEDLRPGEADVARALQAELPESEEPRLLHGDFRLGNIICEGAGVRAVIDWEIWALSDPRIDLAWFLLTADSTLHPLAVRATAGLPSPGELLAEYGRHRHREVGENEIAWFMALALYKMAATSALIVKRNRRKGTGVLSESLETQLPEMLNNSIQLLRYGALSKLEAEVRSPTESSTARSQLRDPAQDRS